jgi:enamine deaminase RidA (YjgF/YER057c/UK114 family)
MSTTETLYPITDLLKTPKTLEQWEALLPQAPTPVGSYVPCKPLGNTVFTSGTLPMKEGKLAYVGRIGEGGNLTIEEGQEAARLCILNALSILKAELGSLSRIKSVVKLVGFVMGTADFYAQPAVINGASDLLVAILGETVGRHARSAVGVANLPLEAPVELELIVEVHPD